MWTSLSTHEGMGGLDSTLYLKGAKQAHAAFLKQGNTEAANALKAAACRVVWTAARSGDIATCSRCTPLPFLGTALHCTALKIRLNTFVYGWLPLAKDNSLLVLTFLSQ